MIKPMPNRILIEPVTRGDQRAKEAAARIPGFELADPELEGAPNVGKVFAVGSDVELPIKPGDTVVFHEQTPKGFEVEGQKLFALLGDQIVAIIEEE